MNGHHELNERQELFCRYYVRRPVGAEAARAAGYEPGSAAVQASRLLDRPDILDRIERMRADVARRHCRDADTILAKLEAVYVQAVEVHQFYAAAHVLTLQARIAGLLPERGAAPAPEAARQAETPAAVANGAETPAAAAMLRNVNGR